MLSFAMVYACVDFAMVKTFGFRVRMESMIKNVTNLVRALFD
jgi:hypothetical protein